MEGICKSKAEKDSEKTPSWPFLISAKRLRTHENKVLHHPHIKIQRKLQLAAFDEDSKLQALFRRDKMMNISHNAETWAHAIVMIVKDTGHA